MRPTDSRSFREINPNRWEADRISSPILLSRWGVSNGRERIWPAIAGGSQMPGQHCTAQKWAATPPRAGPHAYSALCASRRPSRCETRRSKLIMASSTASKRASTASKRLLVSACCASNRPLVSACMRSMRALNWLNMTTIATSNPTQRQRCCRVPSSRKILPPVGTPEAARRFHRFQLTEI